MRRYFLPLILFIGLAACSNQKKEEGGAKPEGPRASATSHSHGSSSAHAHAPGSTEGAHADHNPRHGGIVTMEGDNHVEIVVAKDGAIDLYLTDAVRRPIPLSDISGSIALEVVGKKEKQTLPLAIDAAKGSLSAKGPAPDEKTEYTWSLKVRGTPMSMTLRVPPGGTAAFEKAGAGHGSGEAHAHGSPHGGVVEPFGDTHVEVKIDKGGEVTVWLLDADEKPRPAKGVSASIRLVVPGSSDVKLDYDEKADALRGKVVAPEKEHFDAIVTVTPPGGIAIPVRVKLPGAGAGKAAP